MQSARARLQGLWRASHTLGTAGEASCSGRRFAWTDNRGYQHFGQRPSVLSWGQGQGSAHTWAAYVGGGLGVYFGYLYITGRQEVPFTHRRRSIMFVNDKMDRTMGEEAFKQMTEEAAKSGCLVPPSHPYTQLVRRVGQRIALVAGDGVGGGYQHHMQDLQWEYAVIQSPQVNAMVVPGGKVIVYTGLLNLMNHEAELAAVLAHETAHVLARHSAERMDKLELWSILRFLLWLAFGIAIPTSAMFLGLFLPYSRLHETEADEIGVRLMAHACYDPEANVAMLGKLLAAEHQKEQQNSLSTLVPELLRTHPLTQERVKRVREALPDAYSILQRSDCHAEQDMFRAMVTDMLSRLGFGQRW